MQLKIYRMRTSHAMSGKTYNLDFAVKVKKGETDRDVTMKILDTFDLDGMHVHGVASVAMPDVTHVALLNPEPHIPASLSQRRRLKRRG